ncbi:alpha-amylase family glycosyl hydrolase [Dyadobacter psychrotolerans]|uniref:Alpha-amylase n=1 Tax=Dyadobacter psychrotolerans TaxID=2541721 RepID=A0A4R5D8D5_9BACT|nr:alpha-amylase family glycosyl hydrolase [Dyadobacter psychrotolerans]TDE08160.1 alpha-amylase [Dyadobacter psychrotolerans]
MSPDHPITSIREIDLSPKPGKTYWKNGIREWREEFIYFLLVDRFHDDLERNPLLVSNHSSGFGTQDQLRTTCGGTLKGIEKHLDYIKDLGCTALWLSPVFENNPASYHGYAIQNYLKIDPRFGTKDDLESLVNAAHKLEICVFLDIVLHHSGDNWAYPADEPYYYYQGATFPFGAWRNENTPVPTELRNSELYWKKGRIRNFDTFPETREGDFHGLKTFKNDASPEALLVQQILTKVHCYWMRETDIDGFRIDAVKHMGEETVSQFCSHVREYAYKLGKRNFFLFGELVGPEEMYNKYIGPKTSVVVEDKAIYFGLNSVLDFPLYHILSDVIHGKATPEKLVKRYESLRKNAMSRGEFGEFLVTFIDNHDQVGQTLKQRFGSEATKEQIIAGIGFLLCALGTPCIYYGTEQGFNGSGQDDSSIREAMFSLDDPTRNALNKSCHIYLEIAKLASIRKNSAVLKFGRMYMRKLSEDGKNFHLPTFPKCLLAFSRVLYDEEFVIAYNSSLTEYDEEYILVDRLLNPSGSVFKFIFGQSGQANVLLNEKGDLHFIKLKLAPAQFVILSNNLSDV